MTNSEFKIVNKKKFRFNFAIILIITISLAISPFFSNLFTLFIFKQENSFESFQLKINANEIIIDTPENTTYNAPMDGYYVATHGFENDDDGSDPAGFDDF